MSDQWGAPQPPKAGQAAEPYGAAYAGAPYGGGAGAGRTTNGTALAGAILSVVPLLGLVLSVGGLRKAGTLGGAGKTAAIVGIVLSLLFAGGYGYGIYELASSADVDPACSSMLATESSLSGDESGLAAVDSASGSGGQAALATMVAELRTLKAELDRDVVRATHADVRARIQAVDDDLGQMIADAKAVEGGNDAAVSGLETAAGRLQVDGEAVDSLCGDADGDANGR